MDGRNHENFVFPNELVAYDSSEDPKNNNNDPNKDSDEDEIFENLKENENNLIDSDDEEKYIKYFHFYIYTNY